MKKAILFLLFLIVRQDVVLASHAMGGAISYVSLGNMVYEITFTFYRDCSGIPAPANMFFDIFSSTGATSSVTLNPTPNSPIQLHTVCPTQTTTCNGGPYIGIEKWIYTGVVTLPAEVVTISHAESARNAALTTITGSGSDILYIYAVIKVDSTITNSSPVFNIDPVVSLCQGNSYCLPSYVTDADGDSLVFELITPRTGPLPGDTVQYISPYTTSQPLSSTPPMSLNSATGSLCIIPTASGEVTPIAILVSEFRNGILLGQVERDMQIAVEACTNAIPALTGLNGIPSTSLNVCSGQQNCFMITAVDMDVSNSTFVNWDISLPGATTIHTFGNRDTLFICWTPSDANTLGNPHTFYATVSDDNCPYPGTSFRNYTLNVIPSAICNPVNVSEISTANFVVFPQPAADQFTISFEANALSKKLILFNHLGTQVATYPIAEKTLMINCSALSEGVYIAAVENEYGIMTGGKSIVIIR